MWRREFGYLISWWKVYVELCLCFLSLELGVKKKKKKFLEEYDYLFFLFPLSCG